MFFVTVRRAVVVAAGLVSLSVVGGAPSSAAGADPAPVFAIQSKCVSPNPGDACVPVKIRHERIVGNRKPFTIRAPLTIAFDVRGPAVDVTILHDGLPFAFANECGGCGFHIEVPGEFAVLLADQQTPSLVFTVIG